MDAPYWAETIIKQMGGSNRLVIMIGAHNFLYDDSSVQRSISFKFKAGYKANYVKIELTAMDDYNMTIAKVINSKTTGFRNTPVAVHKGIYFDQLIPLFEKATGLCLTL